MVNQLTTREVLRRCRKWGITEPQLGRWKRAGLLTAPMLHGQGKSRGIQRLWSEDTPARVILIARTLKDDVDHGHKPSLLRAGRALVGAGYLVRVDVLRQLMLDELTDIEKSIRAHRRHFDRLSRTEARKRYEASAARRYRDLPSQGISAIQWVTSTLAGHGREAGLLASLNLKLAIDSIGKSIQDGSEEKLFNAVRETICLVTNTDLWTVLTSVPAIFGFVTGPAGAAVEAVLSAPPRAIGAETTTVSLDDCQESATFVLNLSLLLLAGTETAQRIFPAAIEEARKATSAKPGSVTPDMTLLRTLVDWLAPILEGPLDSRTGEVVDGEWPVEGKPAAALHESSQADS